MKLLSTLLFVDAAHAASVSCMQSDDDDSPIEMTATVTNSEIKHDLTTDGDWTCSGDGDSATCSRSWSASEFTGTGETTFDANNLVLKKTVAAGCTTKNVDSVDVCIQQGHSLEFTCKYPLGVTTVSNVYDVAGHDTVATEEGVGSLKYTLTVTNPNVNIGETVNVEVEAVNKGLVFHHLQDCTVSKDSDNVSILNWDSSGNNLETVCPNVLGAAIGVSNHQDKTSFSWTAFKWSTSIQAPNDNEEQTITCTISLSENAPTVNTPSCEEANQEPKKQYECDTAKGWTKFSMGDGEKCYQRMGIARIKTNPEWLCPNGSRLPLPKNKQENDDFLKVVQSLATPGNFVGLGLNDKDTEGTWMTVDNDPATYLNFKPAPDNYGGIEDYAVFCAHCKAPNGPGNWGDVHGDFEPEMICEKDATEVAPIDP